MKKGIFEPKLGCLAGLPGDRCAATLVAMRSSFSIGLTGFGFALLWPGRYRSEAQARVLVGGQTVPTRNSTADGVTGQHASQSEQLMCAPSLNL
jgi:hypothetical protein